MVCKDPLITILKIVDMDTNNIKAYLRLGQVLRKWEFTNALKIHKGLTIRQNLSSYDKLELYKNIF